MEYHKLVRDRIPEIIREKGEDAKTHIAEDAEYWQKLKEKLLEEAMEFNEAESEEEYADILEVLDAISAHKQFNPARIQELKQKKAAERGGFSKRIILEES